MHKWRIRGMTFNTTTPRKPFAEDVHALTRPYVMTQFLPRWRVISSGTGQRDKALPICCICQRILFRFKIIRGKGLSKAFYMHL